MTDDRFENGKETFKKDYMKELEKKAKIQDFGDQLEIEMTTEYGTRSCTYTKSTDEWKAAKGKACGKGIKGILRYYKPL